MKKILMTLVLLAVVGTAMQAQEIPLLGNVYGRQHITSLNGKWRYIVDVQERGFYDYRMNETRWGFFQDAHQQAKSDLVEYNFDTSEQMNVPGDWNTQDDRLFFYEGTVWFRRTFDYQPQAGKRVVLYFGAVNYESYVYVNGRKMGHHVGGFTPFNFDITAALKEGTNNVIVKVDNKRDRDQIPTNIYDWWNYGGITRDVLLAEVDETYVEDYSLQLDKSNWKHLTGWVKLNKAVAGQTVTVSIPELKVSEQVVTDADGRAALSIKAKPELWSPENPKLYAVTVTRDDEVITDEIGFRCIETQGKQIILNGKPIFLRGVSIHEEAPFKQGRTSNVAQSQTLLSWAKELGCNYVRLAHYPHNELEVREAEKMGIMVWSEIPVYWTIAWESPATYANAENQLTEMIERDQNRCAVIIWSLANETPHGDARVKFLSNLAKTARAKDNTRLLSMAMERSDKSETVLSIKDDMSEYVDIISCNQYMGWYDGNNEKLTRVSRDVDYDKPLVFSEMGGGAVAGYHGDNNQYWTEEYQEQLYKNTLDMIDTRMNPALSGMSPWILMDFRSPRRLLPHIQDGYNRKGLISNRGQKKKAFFVLRDWYNKK